MIRLSYHRMTICVCLALLAMAEPESLRAQPQISPALLRARIPLDSLPIVARIDIPNSADWIAFGFNSVWVVNYRPDRVSRVDARTNKLLTDIPIGRNGCLGILADKKRIYVATCGDGVVNEIDPKTDSIVRRVPVPIKRGREGAFALLNGSFWIPDNVSDSASSSVVRVDMQTGKTVARIPTGARSDVIISGFGSIWVASSGTNVVTRIDAQSNVVIAKIAVGDSPKFMTAGEGAVWVQNRADGSVSRINPSTNLEVARIEAQAPTQAGDITAGGGAVWLSVDGLPVTRINARTNLVTHQYFGGKGVDAIRWGAGALWTADHNIGQLWRIDYKRIKAR
ncbi:MAG: hypothetical protein M3Y64_11865 [Gemmatimonadota bacterium]|nr:hypothetical protein [Gemmatimonadota bacterium]